jgi:mono/diheme cytochrome c family protein
MADGDFNAGTRATPLGDRKTGLSADLDALAAYVASLNSFANSPYRNNDGTLTTAATAGRNVFRAANCAQCHAGTAFTISAAANLQDIGTLKPSSGGRLGGALTGIDVPTLRDAWGTAPYLHDGSAPTLADALAAHGGFSLGATDIANLVSYVQQIGAQETTAPTPNNAPVLANPGSQGGFTGIAVTLGLSASDVDGNTLIFGASGLPNGLTVNSATGMITGTPSTAGNFNVMVTARDAEVTASQSFSWTITVRDTTVPSRPGSFAVSASSGRPVLTWSASTDNIGVVGYIVYRSTNGTQGGEVARTTAAVRTWTDNAFQENVRYTYSVKAYDAANNASSLTSLRSVTPSQAPSTPTLSVALSNGDPRLTWTASTDNVGVTGYIVYRSTTGGTGSEIARTTASVRTWTDSSARAGTRYYYNVRAYDAAGNDSSRSSIVNIRAQ